jgi:hypothetical protein
MASHPDTKIDCSKVYVKKSNFSNESTGEFDGAFAAVPIKKGAYVCSVSNVPAGSSSNSSLVVVWWNDVAVASLILRCFSTTTLASTYMDTSIKIIGELVEKGIMRRLPEGFDGNICQEIFTWSTDRPNKIWAMGSGCSPFYNTDKKQKANTRMERYYDEDRFEIFAARDIERDEELTHTYVSLEWRTCFEPLNKIVNADDNNNVS